MYIGPIDLGLKPFQGRRQVLEWEWGGGGGGGAVGVSLRGVSLFVSRMFLPKNVGGLTPQATRPRLCLCIIGLVDL